MDRCPPSYLKNEGALRHRRLKPSTHAAAAHNVHSGQRHPWTEGPPHRAAPFRELGSATAQNGSRPRGCGGVFPRHAGEGTRPAINRVHYAEQRESRWRNKDAHQGTGLQHQHRRLKLRRILRRPARVQAQARVQTVVSATKQLVLRRELVCTCRLEPF